MDPEYFPNPEQFDPERFNKENKKNIKDFTYIPFGEGPRMCLGMYIIFSFSDSEIHPCISRYIYFTIRTNKIVLRNNRIHFITRLNDKKIKHFLMFA